jgi:hypothetical protein
LFWTVFLPNKNAHLTSTCFLTCKQISNVKYLRVIKPSYTHKEHGLPLRVMAVQYSNICARNQRPAPPPPQQQLTVALGMNLQISRTSGYSSVTLGSIRHGRIGEGELFTLKFQIPSFLLSNPDVNSTWVQYEHTNAECPCLSPPI